MTKRIPVLQAIIDLVLGRYPAEFVITGYGQMKTLKCDLCDVMAERETFEDWMAALRPHYMEAHADVMNDPRKGKEEMEPWMAENRARSDAA